jgi:hypothetical protein
MHKLIADSPNGGKVGTSRTVSLTALILLIRRVTQNPTWLIVSNDLVTARQGRFDPPRGWDSAFLCGCDGMGSPRRMTKGPQVLARTKLAPRGVGRRICSRY